MRRKDEWRIEKSVFWLRTLLCAEGEKDKNKKLKIIQQSINEE
jgi:hypothetical protein